MKDVIEIIRVTIIIKIGSLVKKTVRLVNAIDAIQVAKKRRRGGVFFKKGQTQRRKYRILTTPRFGGVESLRVALYVARFV